MMRYRIGDAYRYCGSLRDGSPVYEDVKIDGIEGGGEMRDGTAVYRLRLANGAVVEYSEQSKGD